MAEKQTFTYYLNIEVEAMNEESAMKKLEGWVEPTLALKKNADLELTSVEYDEPEAGGEEEDTPTEEKTSLVRAAMKKTRPELKVPEKDEFDYDNIPDWEELEEEAPKKARRVVLEDTDELDGLLDGLEDDEEEDSTVESDDDDDEDWDWDADDDSQW
jgi:hypothetical protein|tara:strand:- start:478 stop:951 length:474 start_codon:yes stop_codon:yes gene_type:complete